MLSAKKIALPIESLNRQAAALLASEASVFCEQGFLQRHEVAGATVWDFGVDVTGSYTAGVLLARVSAAGLLNVETLSTDHWSIAVRVESDQPAIACLGCQYAGWPLATEDYFAMVSGPGRSVRGKEPVFEHFDCQLPSPGSHPPVVLVLEADRLPDEKTVQILANELEVGTDQLHLCVASTHSLAGTLQVVARSLETALHQWEVQQGPLEAIQRGAGVAPIPPAGRHSLESIGLTNDAIIYGGQVSLWLTGDWDSLVTLGATIPSVNSQSFGQPFMTLFEAAGKDFYKLDPRLFSPACLQIHDVESLQSAEFGELKPDLVARQA